MPLSNREKQQRRREALDEFARGVGYHSHYKMLTGLLNGELEVKMKYTIVEGIWENGRWGQGREVVLEAYRPDESWLVREKGRSGGEIFRSSIGQVAARNREDAISIFRGDKQPD